MPPIMGDLEGRGEDPRKGRAQTLGDVLSACHAGARVPEKDWVALVRSMAAGDELALRDLYARTHRIVFTLITRITGNRETAEEATLDVFHDVWRRASRYDPAAGSVLAWMLNQARSRAVDRLRYEHRKKRLDDDPGRSLPAATASDPHEVLEARVQGRLLKQALQVLTPAERQAIEASFFSELSYREAAARLNEPLGTVKTRIRSGLSKLRQELAETRGGA